jgi:hypothetical protein
LACVACALSFFRRSLSSSAVSLMGFSVQAP